MEQVIASIDIGSDTIKLIVCEYFNNHYNLLACANTKAEGIKKGLITNPDLASKSIQKAFNEVEEMLGIKIKKVIAIVPSYQSEYKIIKGSSNINEIVTEKNIRETFKNAIRQNLNTNLEFITAIPIDFNIDGTKKTKNPKGLQGENLTSRMMMITTPKKNLYSVASILESLGIELVDVSTESICDISVFKNENIEKEVSAVINIGAEKTSVSLYNKGIPVGTKIITMGGKNVDSDIAYMYRIDVEKAKTIKEKFALATKKTSNPKDFYETENLSGDKIKINQQEVSEIAMARYEEILTLAKNEISLLTNRPVQYIILTGGVSNALNISYLASDILGRNIHLGKINLIGVRNNKYSTALGNIIYFINTLKLKGQTFTMLKEDDMEVLSSPDKQLNHTSNESMLGKVFGYFFGE